MRVNHSPNPVADGQQMRTTQADVATRLYPEIRAGGFSRVDGNIEFYGRINALLSPSMTILDFGAGRGKDATDDPVTFRRGLRVLKGRVATVVGVDPDPVVLTNPSLDRGIVIEENSILPFADESIDLIVSDFCFEHLSDPVFTANELDRVLKPLGWVCARTPNRHGYIGIGARAFPNILHSRMLERLQPRRQHRDMFPTHYRLNTRKQIAACFPRSKYVDCTYGVESEPAYFGTSLLATRIAKTLTGVTPERFSALLYIFLQKRDLPN
jgi:SAM-dependent methyltransferase